MGRNPATGARQAGSCQGDAVSSAMRVAGADGVMAVTHKLVQQAMRGQWQEVPKTIEQRRVLLDRLTATASPKDQQWLGALQQAMAESDAAVAKIAAADAPEAALEFNADDGVHPASVNGPSVNGTAVQIDHTLEMILKGR